MKNCLPGEGKSARTWAPLVAGDNLLVLNHPRLVNLWGLPGYRHGTLSLTNSLWMLFTFSGHNYFDPGFNRRYRGAGDTENVAVVVHSFWLATLYLGGVTILIVGFGYLYFSLRGRNKYDMAVLYLKIIGVGMLFVYRHGLEQLCKGSAMPPHGYLV